MRYLALLLLLPAIALAGTVTISWSPVDTREDGTAVENLARYTVYYQRVGFSEQSVSVSPDSTQYRIPEIFGLYTFAVTATEQLDGQEIESQRSDTVGLFIYPSPVKVNIQVTCEPPTVCQTPDNEGL